MRLIKACSLELQTFNDDTAIPPYAILSHRWVDGQEVLYTDLLQRSHEELEGWQKIDRCCRRALKDGLHYVWVDTCCIDKASSAELSEAINSMYRYYQNAAICYAYLHDVTSQDEPDLEAAFSASAWFTRSWTLQELLAPTSLHFFDKDWVKIGDRSLLAEETAEASGVHLTVFTAPHLNLDEWSIAQRMSWASRRTATRIEDVAYSLLGIFDVNMPLLYGEGPKAFRRLQEEIIRQSNDHTIFAWSTPPAGIKTDQPDFLGLLASSPAAFRKDAHVVQRSFEDATSYAVTNLGLSISLPLEPWAPNIYFASLNCTSNSLDQTGIFILKHASMRGICFRMSIDGKLAISRKANKRQRTSPVVNIAVSINTSQATRLAALKIQRRLLRLLIFYRNPDTDDKKLPAVSPQGAVSGQPDLHHTVRSEFVWRTLNMWQRGVDVNIQASAPCFGTIAYLLLPIEKPAKNRFDFEVTAFKLGLDRELNPIIILAQRSHGELSRRPTLPVNEDRNQDSGARMHYKNFWDCSCLDSAEWQLPSELPQSQSPGMPRGLWALKGRAERQSHFHLQLDIGNELPLPLSISMTSAPHRTGEPIEWEFVIDSHSRSWSQHWANENTRKELMQGTNLEALVVSSPAPHLIDLPVPDEETPRMIDDLSNNNDTTVPLLQRCFSCGWSMVEDGNSRRHAPGVCDICGTQTELEQDGAQLSRPGMPGFEGNQASQSSDRSIVANQSENHRTLRVREVEETSSTQPEKRRKWTSRLRSTFGDRPNSNHS